MNQLVIEFFASFRNSFRISAKNEGISALCRYMSTASNSRSWISVKHESRSNRAFSRTVQTSTLFSTDPQTNRRTFSETKKFFLNGDVKTSLLHKLSFRNETRSFLTLLPDVVLNGSTLNKHAPQRFRHRSVKTGDTSKEKGQETDLEDEDDDDNEEEGEDGDLSHMTYPEDTGFPDNYRELKVHLKSLRLDAVVSAGLNTARNKVDDYFLESKLKLNGERVLKKSKQMKIGDFVDLTMSVVDGKPHVKRVRVLQVDKNKTSKDKLKTFLMSEVECEMQEACGVFGCIASGPWPSSQLDVAAIIATGLMGLQHRGQESAGIVTGMGSNEFNIQKGMGLVSHIFKDNQLIHLKGNLGIGHNRYSTAGCSSLLNCQPFVVETLHGRIAVAHNGELVNANRLKTHVAGCEQFSSRQTGADVALEKLLRHGTGLSTASDSELITQLLAHSPPEGEPNGPDWVARIRQLMSHTLASYSLLVMHDDVVYAIRDPFGNRPLCIGQLLPVRPLAANGNGVLEEKKEIDGWVVSSESCSFQSVGAKYYREVLPGEIVEISRNGVRSMHIEPRSNDAAPAFCIFEYVYFSRPDSILEGQMVYNVRERCGRRLALEAHVDADIVSTVPESATPAALGYSAQSGLPYAEVLCKNRYVGRTFIQPNSHLRQLGVAMKFGVLYENVIGKRIVLIDDSIVRGNTMGPIVKLLKSSGAKEVHIRVASPPLYFPCYMGINIPTRDELIANRMSLQQLAEHLGADSVVYLSLEGLVGAVQSKMTTEVKTGQCTACLSGKYPVQLDSKLDW